MSHFLAALAPKKEENGNKKVTKHSFSEEMMTNKQD
jgi:hypothetical protein